MKEIKLSQGKSAIVDDEDFELLNKLKWYTKKTNSNFYATRNPVAIGGKIVRYMHRLIVDAPKDKEVDHIDGNGLNNQRSNLRVCSNVQNLRNRRSFKNKFSQFKGVSWHKERTKWRAHITNNYKLIFLGYFESEVEAATAYNEAAKKYHGEFARLNNI